MAATQPTGKQIKDASIQRVDLDTSTVGQAVIAKAVQGAGIALTSTGGDAGTGDVTIKIDPAVDHAFTTQQSITATTNAGTGLIVDNNSTGTAAYAALTAQNSGSNICQVGMLSTGYTTNGVLLANSGFIYSDSSVGLSIATAGTIKMAAGGTTKTAELTAGVLNVNTGYQVGGVDSYLLRKVTVLTSSGTYTPTTGCRALMVECIGGGGGGGGALGTATTTMSAAGGGGGGYARKFVTSPAASYTYTIGAAGSAGANTGTAGGAGGGTSFGATSVCTATGGSGGGTGNAAATGPVQTSTGGAGGIVSGTIGDLVLRGGDGLGGLRWSGTAGASGAGGAAACGGGAVQGNANQAAGSAGSQYGGGGSGALSTSTTGFAGGAGAAGCIIVTEYF